MQLSTVHIISMLISLVFALYLGMQAGKSVKSAEDYSLGGRSAGVNMVAGTLLGTIVGGAATVGTSQMAFKLGLSAWWFTLGCGIALVIMGLFYASKLRESSLSTIPEYLVLNYGGMAGGITSIASSMGLFFSVVASMLTSMQLIMLLFKVSAFVSVAIIIVSVLGLVYFGGISGSGVSGLFKMALIFATIFFAGGQAYVQLGELSGIQSQFTEFFWLSLGGMDWGDNIINFLCLIVGVVCTQTYVQAIFSASSTRTALMGTCVAGLITIPVGLPSVIVGMYMFKHHPDIIPITALPLYMVTYMPDWLGGLGITALLLSSIGSIGGIALGMSTMLSHDIYDKFVTNHDPKHLLKINRLFMLAVILGAAFFSWVNMDSLVLYWNYLSMSLRGAGIFVPFTLAIFMPKRISPKIGVVAMLLGVAVSLTWKFIVPSSKSTLLPALAVSLIVCLIGLVVGKKPD